MISHITKLQSAWDIYRESLRIDFKRKGRLGQVLVCVDTLLKEAAVISEQLIFYESHEPWYVKQAHRLQKELVEEQGLRRVNEIAFVSQIETLTARIKELESR